MINTVFYTFSTIAQTLAGAIALLGAFVLYQLQTLRSDIEIDSSDFAESFVSIEAETQIVNWHRTGEYRKIAEFEIDPKWFSKPALSRMEIIQSQLTRNLNQKDSLLKVFKESLWLTVLLIFFAVVGLIFADPIARYDIVYWVVLIFGLLWFGRCLDSYRKLIQKALE